MFFFYIFRSEQSSLEIMFYVKSQNKTNKMFFVVHVAYTQGVEIFIFNKDCAN
ncbi:hypothetical protein BY458DRAFT_524106 [Sporodiniella umbellata]|nr:hypothetical protein BY458DRAFT_524106 [Sporodiniella umbellata]